MIHGKHDSGGQGRVRRRHFVRRRLGLSDRRRRPLAEYVEAVTAEGAGGSRRLTRHQGSRPAGSACTGCRCSPADALELRGRRVRDAGVAADALELPGRRVRDAGVAADALELRGRRVRDAGVAADALELPGRRVRDAGVAADALDGRLLRGGEHPSLSDDGSPDEERNGQRQRAERDSEPAAVRCFLGNAGCCCGHLDLLDAAPAPVHRGHLERRLLTPSSS